MKWPDYFAAATVMLYLGSACGYLWIGQRWVGLAWLAWGLGNAAFLLAAIHSRSVLPSPS